MKFYKNKYIPRSSLLAKEVYVVKRFFEISYHIFYKHKNQTEFERHDISLEDLNIAQLTYNLQPCEKEEIPQEILDQLNIT